MLMILRFDETHLEQGRCFLIHESTRFSDLRQSCNITETSKPCYEFDRRGFAVQVISLSNSLGKLRCFRIRQQQKSTFTTSLSLHQKVFGLYLSYQLRFCCIFVYQLIRMRLVLKSVNTFSQEWKSNFLMFSSGLHTFKTSKR